jgi:hypothetical protein
VTDALGACGAHRLAREFAHDLVFVERSGHRRTRFLQALQALGSALGQCPQCVMPEARGEVAHETRHVTTPALRISRKSCS